MKEYDLSEKIREEMAKDEPAVKAALCIIANQSFDTRSERPQGIFKFEGGIRVNMREIAIHRTGVIDDWRRSAEPTTEEQAVADAIGEVASIIEKQGITSVRKKFGECKIGNNLVRLLEKH